MISSGDWNDWLVLGAAIVLIVIIHVYFRYKIHASENRMRKNLKVSGNSR